MARTHERHQRGERGYRTKDLERERVHVGAERDERGRARANISDDARPCDGAVADPEALELLADEGAGAVLPERELRVRVDAAAAAPPRTPPPRRERETGRRAAGEDPPWFRTGTALAAGRGLRAGERTWTLLSSPVKTDADRPMDGLSGLFFLSLDTDRYANQHLFFHPTSEKHDDEQNFSAINSVVDKRIIVQNQLQ